MFARLIGYKKLDDAAASHSLKKTGSSRLNIGKKGSSPALAAAPLHENLLPPKNENYISRFIKKINPFGHLNNNKKCKKDILNKLITTNHSQNNLNKLKAAVNEHPKTPNHFDKFLAHKKSKEKEQIQKKEEIQIKLEIYKRQILQIKIKMNKKPLKNKENETKIIQKILEREKEIKEIEGLLI